MRVSPEPAAVLVMFCNARDSRWVAVMLDNDDSVTMGPSRYIIVIGATRQALSCQCG